MFTNLKEKLLVKDLKVSLFSLILAAFFIFIPVMSGNSLEHSAPAAVFQVALVDKMADFFRFNGSQQVEASSRSGAGQHVDFAPVKEPFSPVSHLSFEGVISGGLIIGKYAYLSQEGLGLRMIDLEVPSDPVDLGFYPLSGSTFRLANWGNLIFVGGTRDGVQIFELFSGQQNMMGQPQVTLVDRGIIPVEESITAIAADQGKLYVATLSKEIRIYDISDPLLILEVESLPVTLPVRSIAINGSHLYVAAGTDGLHVLDLSVPGKAETVATYPVPSESLYPAGRLVYMATGNRGLHLFLTQGQLEQQHSMLMSDRAVLFLFPRILLTLTRGIPLIGTGRVAIIPLPPDQIAPPMASGIRASLVRQRHFHSHLTRQGVFLTSVLSIAPLAWLEP